MNRTLEMCIICDSETGRSGRGDDSIYRKLNYPLWERFERVTGDEIGPLCSECNSALEQLDFVDKER